MSSTVLCVGCFDILHYGHLLHLQAAYNMGGHLVVAITRDRSVNKGPGRPLHSERHRQALVQALWCVERTLLVNSSIEALKKVKPDLFVLGAEYRGRVRQEDADYCKVHGIAIRFTNKLRMSSTAIYDRIKQG